MLIFLPYNIDMAIDTENNNKNKSSCDCTELDRISAFLKRRQAAGAKANIDTSPEAESKDSGQQAAGLGAMTEEELKELIKQMQQQNKQSLRR